MSIACRPAPVGSPHNTTNTATRAPRLKHFQIRHGAPTRSDPAPDQDDIRPVAPSVVALLGDDMLRMRPRFAVEEGQAVVRGQCVLTDRRHPEIAYVSPVTGTVTTLSYGPRRTLSTCIVTADAQAADTSNQVSTEPTNADAPRETLQSRGLWPAFRTRPFGLTPLPDAEPSAIFVNAVQAAPQAPDPAGVLADQRAAFHLGLTILMRLTNGKVFLCQSPGAPLGPTHDRVVHASFSGTRAAALASTHIDRLSPVDRTREVWTVGYQDVAAIGHLFETGDYRAERVVSVTGPAASHPQLIRTSQGTRIADLADVKTARAFSGAREALHLGRYNDEVTLMHRSQPRLSRSRFAQLFAAQNALVPTQALDAALAVDVLPIPLLRALSVGDSETAERLGCLALIEEDLAALSGRCTSGSDYGLLLRRVLDDLWEDAA